MPKHNFAETTSVNHKVFFEGEAEVSDEDLKVLKQTKLNENEVDEEAETQKETQNKKGK